MKNAMLILSVLLVPAVADAGFTSGATCELTDAVRLKPSPGGKRGPLVRKGNTVVVRGLDEDWYEIEVNGKTGFIKAGWLDQVCVPQTTPATAEPESEAAPPAMPAPTTAAEVEETTPTSAAEPPSAAAEEPASAPSPESTAALATPPEPVDPPPTASPTPTSSAAPVPGSAAATANDDGFGDTYKIKVAVMDLQATPNLDEAMVVSLTKAVPETIDRLGPFKAISAQDVVQMLTYGAARQSLGCDDPSCMSELGDALGADFIVTGNLTLTGDTVTIQLQLLNAADGKVENRVSRQHVGTGETIFAAMGGAAKVLMRPILGQHAGTLLVRASEEGATLTVDGNIVGVSPMREPMLVSGGTHTLGLEKSGFITFRKDVSISEDRQTDVEAVLIPSQEFITAYESEAVVWRALAYTSLGVAAVGFGTGIALIAMGEEQQRALADDIDLYNASGSRSTAEYDRLNQRASELGANELGTAIAFGIGAAAATTGVLLWVLGDDPGRYDAHQHVDTGVSAGLTLAPGWVGIRGGF